MAKVPGIHPQTRLVYAVFQSHHERNYQQHASDTIQKGNRTHPILLKVLLLQTISSRPPTTFTITLMHQPFEEIRRPSIQLLRLAQLIKPKPPLNQVRRLSHQRKPFLQIIHKIDVPIFVCAVDKRQLNSRAAVAAVKQDVQHAVPRERGDEMFV